MSHLAIYETTKHGSFIQEYSSVYDISSSYYVHYDKVLDVAMDNTKRVQQYMMSGGPLILCSLNGRYFLMKHSRDH
jgi:hypothetical protein